LVKQSLAKTVERILEESTAPATTPGEVELGLPSENATMENDRGNRFGIAREDLKTHAMIA